MRLPLELVETLATIVSEGSLDAAARRLQLTPSAVSQRLATLESQVGHVLLVRSKPSRATDAGQIVVRLARQLALLEQDARAELGGADSLGPISIPLAVNADSLATWFLEPLARLGRTHSVVFDLHRDDQDFTVGLLESGTVMGAVTSRERPVAGCRVHPLGVLRYRAVATPGFLTRWLPDGPQPANLSLAPVVDFDRRDDLQSGWLAQLGVDPASPPRHYVPSSNDFARAIRLGLGWGLLPGFQSGSALTSGDLIDLGGPTVDVPLFWQQWKLHSVLLDDIAAEIVAEAGRVLPSPASR